MAGEPIIEIVGENILEFRCDVLALKYAQGWHGADLAVSKALKLGNFWEAPLPGEYRTLTPDSPSRIAAPLVLLEGMPALSKIAYTNIRSFAQSVISHLDQVAPNVKHIAMTVHGVNIGMDEREAFLSQIGGLVDGLASANVLPELERISIVELKPDRCLRLMKILQEHNLHRPIKRKSKSPVDSNAPLAMAGSKTEKPHVFVAMPFTDDMEDVYIFGIQGPIQEAGLLCERVDMDVFTGDILERIKNRIDSADLVIGVLNGANANVYLEVGYAWGKNRRTLLICKNPDELKFDVKGQRCLIYSSINDLNKKLCKEIQIHMNP